MTAQATSALAFSILALSAAVAQGQAGAEACSVCHPEQRVAHEKGIHSAEDVACVDCHGGDGSTREVERAHRGSFRALANRGEIPGACAECHSDLERMRPYNLPIDQYAMYTTSQHGRRVAAGDLGAAVCTDCHGVHEIRAGDDPRSPTYHANLATTCASCHSDSELMGKYGLDAGIVDEYRRGVHGRSLDGGNLAAPDCTSCHGTHGSAPPGLSDVDKVCGSCHHRTRRAFVEGPHHRAMLDAGLPECASCHANHEVVSFGAEEIGTLCSECHDAGSEPTLLSSRLYTLIAEAQDSLDAATALVARGESRALEVEDYKSRIEEGHTYVTEALTLIHAVSVEPVAALTGRAKALGEEVQHELYAKMDRRPARIGLALFWFYIVMTIVVLVSLKNRRGGAL